jgi:HlyD family secretion protein
MKRLLPGILFAAAISGPLWMYSQGATRSGKSRPADATTPTPPRSPDSIQGIGFVEPVSEVRRLVFKANGVIARCRVDLGRAYKKGELLIELDNREQLAAMTVAEAEWKMAQAERDKVLSGVSAHQIEAALRKVELVREQVRHSQKEHSRFHALSEDAVSRLDYDRSLTKVNQKQTELRQAEADLRHLHHYVRDEDRRLADAKVCAARAKLDLAKQLYQDTLLLAPFDGTVLEVLKREGEAARQFDPEPVVLFGDASRLRVRAEIDERFAAGLKIGQKAVVSGRGVGGREHLGRVVLVKAIMGKKTVFSRSATERKDLDVIQLMVEMDQPFAAPIGLEVDVRVFGEF